MKRYEHLTDGLRAVLMMTTRGYRYAVTAEVPAEKVHGIEQKWIDAYGITLPAWRRRERKKKSLPNAWAFSLPVPAAAHKRLLVLLRTDADLSKLDPSSPWLRERWREIDKCEIGDYCVTIDQRDRRDYAWTVKLSARTLRGLEGLYRELSGRSLSMLQEQIERDVRYYPMFGGVRRQMRRLIRGYAKLYQKRLGKQWPGPDPEALPHVGQFKSLETMDGHEED